MEYLKVLDQETTDDNLVLQAPIFLYGGKDLTGEHFTAKTAWDSSYVQTDTVIVDWEHGLRPDNAKIQPGRDDVLGKVDVKSITDTEAALLTRLVLDRRNVYVKKFVEPFARAGLLGASSEPIQDSIQKTSAGGIVTWPLKRLTLTVNPAEPKMLTQNQVRVIKSASDFIPSLKSLLIPTGGKETAGNKQDIQGNDINKSVGDNKMSDKDKVDNAATVEALQEQVKTLGNKLDGVVTALENIPAQTKAHFASVDVIEDETDKQLKANPFKMALMAQAARQAVTNPSGLTKQHKAILGQNEAIPQDGGFLVGTDQSTELEKKMHDEAVFTPKATLRTISQGANSIDFYGRKENSRATGSRYGGVRVYKVAEGGTITPSQMEFYKYTLKPEKYASMVYATDEVINDARILEAEIMDAVPSEMAFELDNDFLVGSSAGYPQGVLNSNSLVTVPKESGQAATTLVAENIINMWARRWVRGNYTWYINQDVTPQLHQLNLPVGTGGALVYTPPGGLAGSPYGTLYGAPVIETEFNKTLGTVGDIVLADWSQYKYATVGNMKVASSMHVAFVTDQMAWRFTNRFDGQSTWEAALTPLNGTNTVSPFIALATRS